MFIARSRRLPRLLPVLVAAFVAFAGVSVAIEVAPAGAATHPTILTVSGGFGQIAVVNAAPGASIQIQGGPTSVGAVPANSHGAKLVRSLAAGTYTVKVGTASSTSVVVRPLSYRSPQSWYAATQRKINMQAPGGYIETTDGTLLNYRLDRPSSGPVNGKYDVVVVYSGYRAGLDPQEIWEQRLTTKLLAQGYAVLGVSMRGTGCSGGALDVMEPVVGIDGYDVIETLNAQSWVDDIAMAGASWLGLSQLFVAQTQPPHLDAIAPGHVVTDFYRDTVYPGGVPNVAFPRGWAADRDAENVYGGNYPGREALPLGDATCLHDQALRTDNRSTVTDWSDPANATYTPFWQARTVDPSKITVPTLLVDSWHDEEVGARPATFFTQLPASTKARLIGNNTGHSAYLNGDIWDEVTKFLDVYLDDVSPVESKATYEQRPRVEVLLETSQTGVSRGRLMLPSWDLPVGQSATTLPLGTALEPEISGSVSSSYLSRGAHSSWAGNRQDRADFVGQPLQQQLVVAGSASVNLKIKTEATDVDLQASLVEVRPDGKELLVQSGWLRASHRAEAANPLATAVRPYHSHVSPTPLTPNTWTDVRVELFPFAHVFRAGSRLKLIVDAPGGAGDFFIWDWPRVAANPEVSISHAGTESALVLPVRSNPQIVGLPASLPTCEQLWSFLCRSTPVINSFAGSVSDDNLVTLTSSTAGAPWNVAGIEGLRWLDTGGVGNADLAPATGTTSFRAPPGLQRYTLIATSSDGVTVHRTIEVDVPGFAGANPEALAAPPVAAHPISWGSPGSSWWASVDGVGLNGWDAFTQPQTTIPANVLTTGQHTIRLTTCTPLGCSNHLKVKTVVAGTVTYMAPSGTNLSGQQNGSSVVARIQPASGPEVTIYSGLPGAVWAPALQVGDQVSADGLLSTVLLDASTQETKTIIVG